jgi:hypothetical protein
MTIHATPSAASTPSTSVAVGVAETKHQKFVRLAESRVTRVLEDLRLVNQLVARSYEHKPAEAETIVKTLSNAVAETARVFSIPFATRVGKAGKADSSVSIFEERKVSTIAETNKTKLAMAKALDLLNKGEIEEAKTILANLL